MQPLYWVHFPHITPSIIRARSEAEFQSVPLERRWVESGRELSMVAAALYAGRSLVLSSWYRYCGTYNSPTDNTGLMFAN